MGLSLITVILYEFCAFSGETFVPANPILACSRALALVLHSRRSHGCIASAGGRGTPTSCGGDLTRGERRSDIAPAGVRIPGNAGASALRREWVLRSRTVSKPMSPASATGFPVRNAG